MNKNYVKKELYEALNYWISEYGKKEFLSTIITKQLKEEKWSSEKGLIFNDYENDFLLDCVINDYVLEEPLKINSINSKEFLAIYEIHKNTPYGYGMERTLSLLGINLYDLYNV